MLLKFFINSHAKAYLRSLAEEFGESTNSIRHELNNLSKAGYLVSNGDGRTIVYRANKEHPLYQEVRNLVHKHLGIDKIVDNILKKLGDVRHAFIVGDYALGKDTGTIAIVIVGQVNKKYLDNIVVKAADLLHRRISIEIISDEAFEEEKKSFEEALLIWSTEVKHN